MRILLTGATGFLGQRTLEQFSLNPDIKSVLATGRTLKVTHFAENSKIKYELGNLVDLGFVKRMVSQADIIVHAAALSSPWGTYEEFEEANLTSIKNLIIAAKESSINRIIYISTPSVYFNLHDRFNIKESEDLPGKFINAYAKTKYEAELELIRSGIPYVILRPRALIGRGDTVLMPRLIRAYNENKLKIVGNGENRVDLTSVANVAYAIELSLNVDAKGLNQVYNISNDEPVNLWNTIEKMLILLGMKLEKRKVPYALATFVARLMELKSKMTDYKEPALTRYSVGTLAKSFTMDISKAKQLLGYRSKVSTDEAMMEFAEWYKDILDERG